MFNRLPLFAKNTYVSDTAITCDAEGHLITTNACTGTKTITNVSPTDTATLLLASNTARKVAMIRNIGTVDVYLGVDDTITTSDGFLLQRGGETFVDTFSVDAWYGITASGTADIRIIEVT